MAGLQQLFSEELIDSFDGRVLVIGAYGAGKTSLVMNLIGDLISRTRKSTDGIDIYYGKLLFDMKKQQLIKARSGKHNFPEAVYQKINAYLIKSNAGGNISTSVNSKVPNEAHLDRFCEKLNAVKTNFVYRRCIPIPILDFAGQYIYYMTHQTFITSLGVYVITFDGSRNLTSTLVGDLYCEAQTEIPTILDNIRLWVSSILAYCSNSSADYPKICFVATHKDLVEPGEREQRRKMFLEEILQSFPEENIRHHLKLDDLFFVDCFDNTDPEIQQLNHYLGISIASNPQWNTKVPVQFLMLEMMLAALVEENKHILPRSEVEQLNKDTGCTELSSQQLDAFLEMENMNGKLTYLNIANLRDYVIINPTCLVDVLKSIVTAVPRISELANGYLRKETLHKIWKRGHMSRFTLYHDYLRELLVHFDVLAEQKRYDKDSGKKMEIESYLVPCMVTKNISSEEMAEMLGENRNSSFAFVFKGSYCPTAIPNRLIASVLSMWNVKTNNGIDMLFAGFVVVNIDRSHDLAIQAIQDKIIIYLVHKIHKNLIVKDLATSIRECLEQNLNHISEVYSFFYDSHVTIEKRSLFHIELKTNCSFCWVNTDRIEKDFDCEHGTTIDSSGVNIWYTDRGIDECTESCPGLPEAIQTMSLSDTQLLRLCYHLPMEKIWELSICLGVPQEKLEEIKYEHRSASMVKFCCLRTGRENNKKCQDFVNAMEASHFNVHTICKILREKEVVTDLPDHILTKIPSDEMIDRLCVQIGKEWQVLGIELGLRMEHLEQIEYDSPRILREVSRKTLMLWKETEEKRRKPTIRDIVFAFGRIGRNPDIIKEVIESCDSLPKHHHDQESASGDSLPKYPHDQTSENSSSSPKHQHHQKRSVMSYIRKKWKKMPFVKK